MATPSSADPRPPAQGDVIEYSFLWKHEQDAGLLEGVKDRRCVIVAVLANGTKVVVAPITGTEPTHQNKIPLAPGQLGLVRESWIVTSELNITEWPGPDLRHARTPALAWWRYGQLSNAKRQKLADDVAALIKGGQANIVPRA